MRKFLFAALVVLTSCGSGDKPAATVSPYYKMSVVFVGSPDAASIKTLVEAVEDKYSLPKTDQEAEKVGSVLVTLRQECKPGVTEMDILKHIYEHGDNKLTFPDQAAASSIIVENSK